MEDRDRRGKRLANNPYMQIRDLQEVAGFDSGLEVIITYIR